MYLHLKGAQQEQETIEKRGKKMSQHAVAMLKEKIKWFNNVDERTYLESFCCLLRTAFRKWLRFVCICARMAFFFTFLSSTSSRSFKPFFFSGFLLASAIQIEIYCCAVDTSQSNTSLQFLSVSLHACVCDVLYQFVC